MTGSYVAPLGAPIWIDIATSDLERAQAFYGAVFGWTFDVGGPELGGYVSASRDGVVVAGLLANDPQWNAPDAWTVYLHAADAEATRDAVVAAGGRTCSEVMDIPDRGRMVVLADRAGAVFALWQPAGHDGIGVVGAAGAPVWYQLTTSDFADSVSFYEQVFGWQLRAESDTDEFRYSNAIFDGQPVLGVMDGTAFMGDAPAQWTVFFGVEDVDATIALVIEHGGSVVRPAEDTPYGRLAALTDATGAAFNLSSLR
jgi:uncharacterized protein